MGERAFVTKAPARNASLVMVGGTRRWAQFRSLHFSSAPGFTRVLLGKGTGKP